MSVKGNVKYVYNLISFLETYLISIKYEMKNVRYLFISKLAFMFYAFLDSRNLCISAVLHIYILHIISPGKITFLGLNLH